MSLPRSSLDNVNDDFVNFWPLLSTEMRAFAFQKFFGAIESHNRLRFKRLIILLNKTEVNQLICDNKITAHTKRNNTFIALLIYSTNKISLSYTSLCFTL